MTTVALAAALLAVTTAAPVAAGTLNDMISPVSAPTVNEDPRNLTEIRPLFLFHHFPDSFVLGEGDLQVVAVQARVALHERFSFIATKDGYVWVKPDALDDDLDGWANVAVGFKGSLLQSEEWAAILSAGIRYETRWGSREVFQGRGDGVLNPFLTAAKGFGDFHAQLYTGPRLPLANEDSTLYDTNLHFDYRLPLDLPVGIYPLMEVNWLHVIRGGRRYPFTQEGSELVNLGARDSAGDIVTMALGARVRLFEWLDVGATGEFPLTAREDIFDWRVTWDLSIRPFGFSGPAWPWT